MDVSKPFSAPIRDGARVTRTGLLRTGYAALGLTFLAFAATFSPAAGILLGVGLLAGFVGAGVLAFSDEDLPKWAGISIVAYLLLCLVAFLASSGATIRIGGTSYFVNDSPPPLFDALADYLILGLPFLIAGAALVAVWEAGHPRWLVMGAAVGFVVVALLTLLFTPDTVAEDVAGQNQGLAILFALAAVAGAIGSFWASARPEGA